MAVNEFAFKRHTSTVLMNSTEKLRRELTKAIFKLRLGIIGSKCVTEPHAELLEESKINSHLPAWH